MSITVNYAVSVSGAGVSISRSVPRVADSGVGVTATLPAGKAGTLSTRTDDNTGVATLSSGHGITTSDTVDVYWDGGVRYGMTCDGAGATTISLDGGAGDNFPAQDTAVVCTPQIQINCALDGDELAILALQLYYTNTNSTGKGHADFQDAEDDSIAEIDFTANEAKVYDIDGGSANPFTGDPITKILASNGSATEAAELRLVAVQDSTP